MISLPDLGWHRHEAEAVSEEETEEGAVEEAGAVLVEEAEEEDEVVEEVSLDLVVSDSLGSKVASFFTPALITHACILLIAMIIC